MPGPPRWMSILVIIASLTPVTILFVVLPLVLAAVA